MRDPLLLPFLLGGLLFSILPALSFGGSGGGGGSLLSLSLDPEDMSSSEWTSGSRNRRPGGNFGGPPPEEEQSGRTSLIPGQTLTLLHFSNKSITCNDGSPAGYYMRTSRYRSKTWIIFLEGGWYCFNEVSCQNRWLRAKSLMTSMGWPRFRHVGGILSPDARENPYWWNANHIFVPYCSSDAWSGTVSGKDSGIPFSFMGSLIVDQVIRNLVSFGGLQSDSTVILAGSSAGGTGVMINLDRVESILREEFGVTRSGSPRVRGITDSGWFIDNLPSYAEKVDCNDVILCPPEISLQKGMELWRARLPQSCADSYPGESWSCFFGYKLYPTLRAPLFVFQWLFDEAQLLANNVPNPPLRKEEWDFVYKIGDELKKSLLNVTSVMTPACMWHNVLTRPDWRHVEVNSIHLPRALKCWESGGVIEESNFIPSSRPPQLFWEQDPTLRKNGGHRKPPNSDFGIFIESNDSSRRHRRRHDRDRQRNNNKRRRRRRKKLEEQKQRQHKKELRILESSGGNLGGGRHSKQNKANDNSNKQLTRSCSPRKKKNRNRRWFSLCDGGDMRLIEKCSWPQCNKSCPKLTNRNTGEEVDFKDLLKSFGLDMATMARALGIDLATLDSMDHQVLLQMLTQHS